VTVPVTLADYALAAEKGGRAAATGGGRDEGNAHDRPSTRQRHPPAATSGWPTSRA
jgi:hypothetical protein